MESKKIMFLVVSHDSIRGCVRGSVGPSVRGSRVFFSSSIMHKNELVTEKECREGEASRD